MKLNFAKNLKSFRTGRGLTQSELAEVLGVSGQAISRWENTTHQSYPDIELLPTIASFFDVSVDELLGCSKAQAAERLRTYWERVNACEKTKEGRLQKHELLKEMYKLYPNDYEIMNAFCLSECWSYDLQDADMANHSEDLALLLEMVEKLQKCAIRHYREYAVTVLIRVIDDAHLEECLDKYTSDMDISRYQLLEWRYSRKRDSAPDRYYDARQRNLLYAIRGLFSIKSGNKDDLDDNDYCLWRSKMLIGVMDALCGHPKSNPISGDGKPDLWTAERISHGIRLAECICATDKEAALAILEDAAKLAEGLCALPSGTVLSYRSPCLDRLFAPLEHQESLKHKSPVLKAQVASRDHFPGLHYSTQSIYTHLVSAADPTGKLAPIRDTAQFNAIVTRFRKMAKLEE